MKVPQVAIVDADVRIHGPDQHAVYAAVARVQIIQIPVDRIFTLDGIVEVALLDHHLRLDKIALRPLKLRAAILSVVKSHAREALVPPDFQVMEPGWEIGLGIGRP